MRLAASHYSVMTKSSAMFVAGPPVVARLRRELTKQELGGLLAPPRFPRGMVVECYYGKLIAGHVNTLRMDVLR